MAQRWATFDCYGTLIDWERGLSDALSSVWPDVEPARLLADHHAVEPRVQLAGDLSYREVLARGLRAIAVIEGLEVPRGREDALAESLASWPPFPEVPAAMQAVKDDGWSVAILSNTDPDLLAGSIRALGVEFDLTITAAEAGSYKPSPGHWERFRESVGPIERHIHVAASLFHDIAPAAALGLEAIWINRAGESSDLPRMAELPDLSALPETLRGVA